MFVVPAQQPQQRPQQTRGLREQAAARRGGGGRRRGKMKGRRAPGAAGEDIDLLEGRPGVVEVAAPLLLGSPPGRLCGRLRGRVGPGARGGLLRRRGRLAVCGVCGPVRLRRHQRLHLGDGCLARVAPAGPRALPARRLGRRGGEGRRGKHRSLERADTHAARRRRAQEGDSGVGVGGGRAHVAPFSAGRRLGLLEHLHEAKVRDLGVPRRCATCVCAVRQNGIHIVSSSAARRRRRAVAGGGERGPRRRGGRSRASGLGG